jgi:ABC-type dipeptide/oligopeptide/nickel transport system ATPase component
VGIPKPVNVSTPTPLNYPEACQSDDVMALVPSSAFALIADEPTTALT